MASGCTRTGTGGWSGRLTKQTALGGKTTRWTRRTGRVARELERPREAKSAERQRLDEECARFRAEQPRHRTAADRERITALAADLPGPWHGVTTAGGDRRAIVRLRIERVESTRHGDAERVTVAIHWRGGAVTRREVRRGLRGYRSLGGTVKRRERVPALRGDGQTAEEIAATPNREGRPARGAAFTGDVVRQLLARFGQTGVPPGVRDAGDLPGVGEWRRPELAAQLGVKPIAVHRWRWPGWLRARQLRGKNGRWLVWASPAEVTRPSRLRAFEVRHEGRRTPPAKLTTPAKQRRSDRSTTHSQNGGD